MPIIVASGTFSLRGRWLFATGSFSFQAGPPRRFEYQSIGGLPTSGTLQGSFPGDGVLTGTGGSWSPATLDTVPSGFLPTTNLRGRLIISNQFFPSVNVRLWQGLLCAENYGPTFVDGFSTIIEVTIPDDSDLVELTGLVTASVTDHGGGSSDIATVLENDIILSGNYVIIVFWWTIPVVNACGERHNSRFKLSSDQPIAATGEGVYERLDPDDPDAHPQPVIESIEANHGPVEGGNTVVIRGSGFGDDADVTFDGVSATDIVVVSQFEIQCVVPPHAADTVVVIVINADGVTS